MTRDTLLCCISLMVIVYRNIGAVCEYTKDLTLVSLCLLLLVCTLYAKCTQHVFLDAHTFIWYNMVLFLLYFIVTLTWYLYIVNIEADNQRWSTVVNLIIVYIQENPITQAYYNVIPWYGHCVYRQRCHVNSFEIFQLLISKVTVNIFPHNFGILSKYLASTC